MSYGVALFGRGLRLSEGVEIPYARAVGRELAKRGVVVCSGGGNGLPYEGILGAAEIPGSERIGFSPAHDDEEHLGLGFSLEGFTEMRYPIPRGQRLGDGKAQRGTYLINYVDAAIVFKGTIGTDSEFVYALHEDKSIGFFTGEGGWNEDKIRGFIESEELGLTRRIKKGKVIYESDPEVLVAKILQD